MKAQNVPSLYALKKSQDQILKLLDDPTRKVVSKSGTVFYINDVAQAVAKVSYKLLCSARHECNQPAWVVDVGW